MSTNEDEANLTLVAKVGAVVAAGVLIPGLVSRYLHASGLNTLGTFVFGMGFFGMIIVVWYVWIRPIDFTGPMG